LVVRWRERKKKEGNAVSGVTVEREERKIIIQVVCIL